MYTRTSYAHKNLNAIGKLFYMLFDVEHFVVGINYMYDLW